MKKRVVILFFEIVLICSIANATDRINPASDLIYRGAFRLPDSGDSILGVNGRAITYDPSGNSGAGSLWGAHSDSIGVVHEFDIPEPVISKNKNINELYEASIIRSIEDIASGQVDGRFDGERFGGLLILPAQGPQTDYTMYYSVVHDYGTPAPYSLGWFHGLSNIVNADPAGLWKIDSLSQWRTSYYLIEIPDEWAKENGINGKILGTGIMRRCGGCEGRSPSLFAIEPWLDGNPPPNQTSLNYYTTLIYYDDTGDVESYGEYGSADDFIGAAFLEVGNKKAVIFGGEKSSNYGYYSNQNMPDSCNDDSGYHSWGRYPVLLFYDTDEIASVASGASTPDKPKPYKIMQLENYMFFDSWCNQVGGKMGSIAYDRTNNLLYIVEDDASSIKDEDIVHVFELNDAGGFPDVTKPSAFDLTANLNGNDVDLSWTESTDSSGKVIYIIYRKAGEPVSYNPPTATRWINWDCDGHTLYGNNTWTPIAVTRDTSYTDKKAYGNFNLPWNYKVEAHDLVNNIQSVELTIGEAVDSRCGRAYGMGWVQEAQDARETSDGGFIIVGETEGMSFSLDVLPIYAKSDVFVVKTDSSGNELWRTVIGEAGHDIITVHTGVFHNYAANSVLEISDGYLISGTKETISRNKELFIIKVDFNGNFLWEKNYGSNSEDNFRTEIINTNDGNFVFSAWSRQYGGCYIVKIDTNGDIVWEQSYNNADCRDIAQTNDGGFILTGDSWAYSGDPDFYLLKITSSGDLEWEKGYIKQGTDYTYQVVEAYDGGYLIVGRSETPTHDNNIYLIKTDNLGNFEWEKTYGGSPGDSYRANGIVKEDNYYVLGGYSSSPYDGLIMAINQEGDEMWRKNFGNSEDEYLWSLSKTSDDGFLLAGSSLSFTTAYDMYIAKLDASGGCSLITDCDASGIYYYDKDYDGFGTDISYIGGTQSAILCIESPGYVTNNLDCNDTDPSIMKSSSCTSGADEDSSDSVSIDELIAFIEDWKNGGVTINQIIIAIGEWKKGC